MEHRLWLLEQWMEKVKGILGPTETVNTSPVVKTVNTKKPNKDGAVEVFAKDIKYASLNKTLAELLGMVFDSQGKIHVRGDLIVDGALKCNNLDDGGKDKQGQQEEEELLILLSEEQQQGMQHLLSKLELLNTTNRVTYEDWDDYHAPPNGLNQYTYREHIEVITEVLSKITEVL
ncbi:hypothetical protein FACS189472_11020 [Alphaproteobacteria bacterium]|nr:hypothetical protein FACS189472_11020 [Alphaproteobacteria bacterium]